jgi:hypothetical protein
MKTRILILLSIMQVICLRCNSQKIPIDTINQVVRLIQGGNYQDLINKYFSNVGEIRFVPHSFLSNTDLKLAKQEILEKWVKTDIFHWGTFEGSGFPIDLSIKEYFENFITLNPNTPNRIAINKRIIELDGSDNVYREYANETVVDIVENYDSPNEWQGVKVVFHYNEGAWRIICLVFSRYEI